jgi:hypothetical protein
LRRRHSITIRLDEHTVRRSSADSQRGRIPHTGGVSSY